MKTLILALVAGFAVSSPAIQTETVAASGADIVKLMEGFFVGVAIDLEVEDIEECIGDTEKIASDLETAFKDYEEHTFGSVEKAIKEIAAAFELVPASLRECEKAPESAIVDLEKALEIFSDPWRLIWVFGKTLILDGKQIFEEIDTAKEDWDSGLYYDCGKNIGEALFKFVQNE